MKTRSTRRSGRSAAASAAAAAADDSNPAMEDNENGEATRGSRRSAFGNSARNAANRDGADGKDGKGKGGKGAASGAAARAGKRGRNASAAAAPGDVKVKTEKRTTRSASRGRTGARAKSSAKAKSSTKQSAGTKRKAIKSDPDASSSDNDDRDAISNNNNNKRIKKERYVRTSSAKVGAQDVKPSARDIVPRDLDRNGDFLVPPDYRLVRSNYGDGTALTTGLAPQDVSHATDILRVAPYVSDMFQHFYVAEAKDAPKEYMEEQPDINAKMRAILIDWLVEVHMKFRLVPETLYLCVNLIDRYCQLVDVKRSELQLVGVTALLVACKYEEIYPPEVRDCVYITDRAYLRQQVLDMEQDILAKLKFRITVPTAYPFLSRFLTMVDASDLVRHAASFYMERTLQEHDLLRYRPSVVAASAVILAMNNPSILAKEGAGGVAPGFPKVLLEYTGFAKSELRQVSRIICTKVGEEPVTASRRQLVAVKRKFDHDRYKRVSTAFDLPDPSHIA
mmetsp:Transcript_5507/g.12000  ORF Transcript_5507/g.12000 Transcript_5507/m.12000 type:complete len:508 (+) Transcript_5507:484-2007(+)